MKIYERKSQFGWKDDKGVGENLIQLIKSGKKTATTSPRELFNAQELKELYGSIGQPLTVIDKDFNPRCNIVLDEVFETTWGAPDLRLLIGEGYGSDAEAFRKSHLSAWADLVKTRQITLENESILIVELFHLLKE